ncbi:MAG: hypothetical protein R3266_05415 [Gemmatimonadota bacterium]|nr:hypothetical protein [Gemmatimonadota bacterium]
MSRRPGGLAAICLALAAIPAASQDPTSADGSDDVRVPRIGSLPDAPFATMGMKLERTIFDVDVLALTVRVDRGTAERIREALHGVERYDDRYEDDVAAIAIDPREAVARIDFLRGIRLDQFLDGVVDDMEKAVEASWVEPETASTLRDSLPVWFGFLEERGIRDGDRLAYHIEGDTLRTVFWGSEERAVLLDQTDVGRQNVLALLGAYFAPGSSFREDLVESLWKGWDPANP